MASCIHSAEELNFLRLVDLTIRIGPLAVRHEFDLQFPPSGLGTWLTTNRNKVQKLKDKKKIFDTQWDLLYPTGGHPVSSEEFDITLMVCLLRNFANVQINDHDNPKTYTHDSSKDANISRIKYYRNKIVHSKDGEIGEQDFTDIWNCVSGAILSLAGNLNPQVKKLATASLDIDTLNLLKQHEKEMELTRKIVLENERRFKAELDLTKQLVLDTEKKLNELSTEKSNAEEMRQIIIEEWKKNGDACYKETSATKFILETLSTKRGVIVTGPPGCGKSAVAHHVALILEGQNYEVYPISQPSEIMKVFEKEKKQVFVIDDICGKFVFEQSLSDDWERQEKCIEKLLKEETRLRFPTANPAHDFTKMIEHSNYKGNVEQTQSSKLKIVVTCRENIYLSKSFPKFTCFDLQLCSFSNEYKLSTEELSEIALSYLDQTTLNKIEDITLFDFFPLLCSSFSSIKNSRLFTHPVEVIDLEIKGLRTKSTSSFIALSLLVLHDNDLKKDTLKDKETDEIIEEISKECEIEQANRIRPDHVTFERLMGFFISESKDSYTAVHDKMFDIIAISISSFIMGVIIKFATSSFIKNRMQLKYLEESSLDNVINVPVELEELFLNRQNTEIKKGNYWTVFGDLNTKNENYRKRLIKYLEKHFDSMDFQQNSESITPLYVVASLGYIELVKYFVKTNIFHLKINDNEGKTPIMIACEKGHSTVVQFLHTFKHRFPTMMRKTNEGWSSLHLAADNGHTDVLEYLIQIRMNVNETTNENYSPLLLASENGHYDTVKHLLEMNGGALDSRVDTRIKDENGYTALHVACLNGHTQVVTLLINVGMNVNDQTNDKCTPLHLASENGHHDTVKHLLDMNGDILDSQVDTKIKNEFAWTALHLACLNGHTNVVELLINIGMDVNQTANERVTPFHLAVANGHYDTVKSMLDMNGDALDSHVDTTIKDESGWTALHAACFYGHTNILQLLANVRMDLNQTAIYKNQTPLYLSSFNGHYDTVKYLLDMNGDKLDSVVDTKIKNEDGWTPLHVACFNGHTNVTELLIKVGMDVNEQTNNKCTPLYLACEKGHCETVKHLLDMNGDTLDIRVDTKIKNEYGKTALHIACLNGHTNVAKLLINAGIDVNQTTCENSTPLFIASEYGHYDIIKELIDMNGDVLDSYVDTRIRNKEEGLTALHVACINGHTNVAKLLIDAGMDVNQTNNDNSTPLFIASVNGHADIVKHLINLNGDVLDSYVDTGIKNQKGATALHAACFNGYTNVVELLIKAGMDVNQTINDNRTPLYLASESGHYYIVKHLLDMNGETLDSRVDTRIKDKEGLTVLHIAC